VKLLATIRGSDNANPAFNYFTGVSRKSLGINVQAKTSSGSCGVTISGADKLNS